MPSEIIRTVNGRFYRPLSYYRPGIRTSDVVFEIRITRTRSRQYVNNNNLCTRNRLRWLFRYVAFLTKRKRQRKAVVSITNYDCEVSPSWRCFFCFSGAASFLPPSSSPRLSDAIDFIRPVNAWDDDRSKISNDTPTPSNVPQKIYYIFPLY